MSDLISRQAILDRTVNRNSIWNTITDSEGNNLEDILNSISSVENKGEWIYLDECANSGYYCSICHKKLVKDGWSDTVKKIKFCPNCGADMRGET